MKAVALGKLANTQLALFHLEEVKTGYLPPQWREVKDKAAKVSTLVRYIKQTGYSPEQVSLKSKFLAELLQLERELSDLCFDAFWCSLEEVEEALSQAAVARVGSAK